MGRINGRGEQGGGKEKGGVEGLVKRGKRRQKGEKMTGRQKIKEKEK